MIRWILNNKLGTAPFNEGSYAAKDLKILDVRDLVDKSGNTSQTVRGKIDQAVEWLNVGSAVLICCDHGISRSNAIAAGILSIHHKIDLDSAIKKVIESTGEKAIKLEVLSAVRLALGEIPKNDFNNDSLIITGSSGFIGKTLLDRMKQKRTVYAVLFQEVNLLSDVIALDGLVKKHRAGTLIHLAAPAVINTNQAISDALLMLKNVLDVCRENDTRLIFPSSWEVYSGYKTGIHFIDEHTQPIASTIFGITKLLSEELIHQYHQTHRLKYIVLRPTVVYGAGGSKPRFLVNFIDKARKNEPIITHAYNNGLPLLDMLHINDLAAAIEKSLDSTEQGIFNLGTGSLVSTKNIAESIVSQLKSKSVVVQISINEPIGQINYQVERAHRKLDWQAHNLWQNSIAELI